MYEDQMNALAESGEPIDSDTRWEGVKVILDGLKNELKLNRLQLFPERLRANIQLYHDTRKSHVMESIEETKQLASIFGNMDDENIMALMSIISTLSKGLFIKDGPGGFLYPHEYDWFEFEEILSLNTESQYLFWSLFYGWPTNLRAHLKLIVSGKKRANSQDPAWLKNTCENVKLCEEGIPNNVQRFCNTIGSGFTLHEIEILFKDLAIPNKRTIRIKSSWLKRKRQPDVIELEALADFLYVNRFNVFSAETRKLIGESDWRAVYSQDTMILLGEMAQHSPKTAVLMLIRLLELLDRVIHISEEPSAKLMKIIRRKLEEIFDLKNESFFAMLTDQKHIKSNIQALVLGLPEPSEFRPMQTNNQMEKRCQIQNKDFLGGIVKTAPRKKTKTTK